MYFTFTSQLLNILQYAELEASPILAPEGDMMKKGRFVGTLYVISVLAALISTVEASDNLNVTPLPQATLSGDGHKVAAEH